MQQQTKHHVEQASPCEFKDDKDCNDLCEACEKLYLDGEVLPDNCEECHNL